MRYSEEVPKNFSIYDILSNPKDPGDIVVYSDDILTEETVYRNDYSKIYIAMHPTPDRGFLNMPYYKVSWVDGFRTEPAIARITMGTPYTYQHHNGDGAKLNSSVAKELVTIFSKKTSTLAKYKQQELTVWDALLQVIIDYSNNQSLTLDDLREVYPCPVSLNNIAGETPGQTPWGSKIK